LSRVGVGECELDITRPEMPATKCSVALCIR